MYSKMSKTAERDDREVKVFAEKQATETGFVNSQFRDVVLSKITRTGQEKPFPEMLREEFLSILEQDNIADFESFIQRYKKLKERTIYCKKSVDQREDLILFLAKHGKVNILDFILSKQYCNVSSESVKEFIEQHVNTIDRECLEILVRYLLKHDEVALTRIVTFFDNNYSKNPDRFHIIMNLRCIYLLEKKHEGLGPKLLRYCSIRGLVKEVERLLQAGVEQIEDSYCTPLVLIVDSSYSQEKLEIARLLLKYDGATLTKPDKWGKTASDYAIRKENVDLIMLFMEAMMDMNQRYDGHKNLLVNRLKEMSFNKKLQVALVSKCLLNPRLKNLVFENSNDAESVLGCAIQNKNIDLIWLLLFRADITSLLLQPTKDRIFELIKSSMNWVHELDKIPLKEKYFSVEQLDALRKEIDAEQKKIDAESLSDIVPKLMSVKTSAGAIKLMKSERGGVMMLLDSDSTDKLKVLNYFIECGRDPDNLSVLAYFLKLGQERWFNHQLFELTADEHDVLLGLLGLTLNMKHFVLEIIEKQGANSKEISELVECTVRHTQTNDVADESRIGLANLILDLSQKYTDNAERWLELAKQLLLEASKYNLFYSSALEAEVDKALTLSKDQTNPFEEEGNPFEGLDESTERREFDPSNQLTHSKLPVRFSPDEAFLLADQKEFWESQEIAAQSPDSAGSGFECNW